MDENAEETECEGYESVTTITEEGEESRFDDSEKYESTLRITKQLIKEVQQELCLVKLCWPEVDVRKDLYLRTLPSSYHTVSGKEKVLAWYAENFRRQFHTKYPDRKPLLLACENECGIQVSLSKTITICIQLSLRLKYIDGGDKYVKCTLKFLFNYHFFFVYSSFR